MSSHPNLRAQSPRGERNPLTDVPRTRTVGRPRVRQMIAAVVLALLGIVVTGCEPDEHKSAATAEVIPHVEGMNLQDAKDALQPTGLDIETVDITGQDRMVIIETNWIVASQDPAAGEPVRPYTTITLTIGKEGETAPDTSSSGSVTVPAVVGMRLPEAKTVLKGAGLSVEVHDDTGEDRSVWWESNWSVSSQSITAGETTTAGQTITLGVIKDGEQPRDTPEVTSPTTVSAAAAPSTEGALDPQVQDAINDATYLGTLDLVGIDYGDPDTAISAAHRLCRDLTAGTDPFMIRYAMITSSIDNGAMVSGDEAQAILEAATVAYCPDYTDAVVNSGTPR